MKLIKLIILSFLIFLTGNTTHACRLGHVEWIKVEPFDIALEEFKLILNPPQPKVCHQYLMVV